MNDEQGISLKEPRERILEAGAELFGTKGYSAVGVREIAQKANVNISMISYYYSGKFGILQEIIRKYFDNVRKIFLRVSAENLPPDETIRKLVDEFVTLMRDKTIFCKVAITEMPFNLPEFADFKAEVIKMHIEYLYQTLEITKYWLISPKYNPIVGPAAISLIFSHFLFGPFIKRVWDIELDDDFYSFYSKTISTMLLEGLEGLKKMINQEDEENLK